MIGSTTRRFTKRSDSVTVVTVSLLRERLDGISTSACKFAIEKVGRDRVTIRAERLGSGKHMHPCVVLPSYPTGHADDVPGNPNVVLDPLEFLHAETHTEREIFLPLLGHDALLHFEKMHPQSGLTMTRCC